MEKLKELLNDIENIEITYNYEESYNNLYDRITDYENDSQDFDFDTLFEDIISYETAEEIAKREIENGGLIGLYYFLGDANLNNSMFLLNGYGNLEDIYKDTLDNLKEEIIDLINDKINENKEGI